MTEPHVPSPPSCVACAAHALTNLGRLPIPARAASDWDEVDVDQIPTWRWLCHNCGVQFRHPIPSAETILERYTRLKPDEHWKTGSHPIWPHVERVAERAPERRILDAGCFRGEFLEWLGPKWERYGIEPSIGASAVAASKGLRILGSSIDDAALVLPPLGAITLIDVLEHLPNPMGALRRLASALVEGGRLVIFTGNTEAPSWRISGARYWYSAIPEHIAFFSRSWFHWAAPHLGCSVGTVEKLAHDPASSARRVVDTGLNLAHLLFRRLPKVGHCSPEGRYIACLPGLGALANQPFAWWTSARDHVLVELVKLRHDA